MGGTFNPPHNAHLLIAELAREQYKLDRVLFVTSGDPPHKNGIISAEHRFNMTRLAIEENFAFYDDPFEIENEGKSYTVRTLEYLKEKYPSDELFFIIGEDSLNDLGKWYRPEEILKLCTVLVFPRSSREGMAKTIKLISEKKSGAVLPIDAPVIEISSTDIRKRVESGKTVRYMLPDKVLAYIKENHLYEGTLNGE